MATWYLINPVQFGAHLLWPGALIDDVQEDAPGILAAGGVLVTSSNATIAAAAPLAQQVKLNGGEIVSAAMIMFIAYAAAGLLAAGSVSETELANGAVTNGKIGALAVDAAKIALLAVGNPQMAAGAALANLADNSVPAVKLVGGAGVAAAIAAGLGNSVVAAHDTASPLATLAAHATKARAMIVIAVVTEAFTTTCAMSVQSSAGAPVVLLNLAALTGTGVYIGAGVVPAHVTESAVVTAITAGATGEAAITVLALPTT